MNEKVENLKKLDQLRKNGALTDEEFEVMKKEILADKGENASILKDQAQSSSQSPKNNRKMIFALLGSVFIGLVVFFIASSLKEAEQSPKTSPAKTAPEVFSFMGSWGGVGYQDTGSKWTMKVVLSADGYSVDYPSLLCGGYLELISKSTYEMTFKEKLTRKSTCVDEGKLVISRIDNNELRFVWYYPNGKEGANSRLKRYTSENEFSNIINIMDPALGLKKGDCAQVTFIGGGFLNAGETTKVRGRITYSGTSKVFLKIISMTDNSIYYEGKTVYTGNEIEVKKSWVNTCT
jgi:hypothetical protein